MCFLCVATSASVTCCTDACSCGMLGAGSRQHQPAAPRASLCRAGCICCVSCSPSGRRPAVCQASKRDGPAGLAGPAARAAALCLQIQCVPLDSGIQRKQMHYWGHTLFLCTVHDFP